MRANLRSDPKSIDRSYQLASRSRYASRTINLGPSPPPSRQSDRNIGAEPVRGGGVVSRGPRIPTPWIESAQCGRFQFVSRSPRGNEGKKKERRNEREGYWPRCKNGSGPIAKGGRGERVRSARCHIPLVGLPGFKSVLLGPPLPSAIIGRNKLNRFFLGRPPSYFAALARFSSSSCCFATSRDRRAIADFARPPPRHVGRGDREDLWTLQIGHQFRLRGGRREGNERFYRVKSGEIGVCFSYIFRGENIGIRKFSGTFLRFGIC